MTGAGAGRAVDLRLSYTAICSALWTDDDGIRSCPDVNLATDSRFLAANRTLLFDEQVVVCSHTALRAITSHITGAAPVTSDM
jgi:hypothetical protein